MKIAYLDCFSGISGDMFLGALVDAGVPIEALQSAVASLELEARLDLRRVNRSGIDSAKVDVLTTEGELAEIAHAAAPAVAHEHTHEHSHDAGHADHDHSHGHEHSHSHEQAHAHGRSLSAIQGIIRGSSLPAEVQRIALRAFELLGYAEAKIHNVQVESIHFHEVGAVDAIADIVGVAAGCHWLATEWGVERWICSPLNVGGGHVHCAHGTFPVPAPATLELLRDLPVYASGVKKELVTPTGAALLRALDVTSSNFPAMRMSATGYGAGSRDIPGKPNVLRLVVGEATSTDSQQRYELQTQARIGIIETTIDDATPELLSYVADKLIASGASDVYRTPIQMKKGRAAVQLTVLCSPSKSELLREIVFRETTTLGLRYREEHKFVLLRRFDSVTTQWGEIQIKIGTMESGEAVNYAPEFEDCRKAAETHNIPLKQVMQAAMAAYFAKDGRA